MALTLILKFLKLKASLETYSHFYDQPEPFCWRCFLQNYFNARMIEDDGLAKKSFLKLSDVNEIEDDDILDPTFAIPSFIKIGFC